MHLLPAKELGRLLQAMQTAAKQAKNKYKVWELDHGIRLTCQDCELHFESFADSELIHKFIPYGHPPQPFQCIVNRALLAKLCKAIARSGVSAIIINGTDQGITLTSPEASFRYTLAAAKEPQNFPLNRLRLSGIPANIDIYQTTRATAMITVTRNYFQDLTAAIEAGAIVKRGKNPSKTELYAAIDEHNATYALSPLMTAEEAAEFSTIGFHAVTDEATWDAAMGRSVPELEAAGDEAGVSAALLAMDAVDDAKPKAVKVKAPKIRENRGVSGKCLNKAEVWTADRIRAIKRESQTGRVLEFMACHAGSVYVDHAASLDLTRTQFIQAIGSISEAGYGIVKDGDRYTVILPAELSEPKLK